MISGGFWVSLIFVWSLRRFLLNRYRYRIWRVLRAIIFAMLFAGFVVCVIFIPQVRP